MMNVNVSKANETLMVPSVHTGKRLMKEFISLGSVRKKLSTELRDYGMFRA